MSGRSDLSPRSTALLSSLAAAGHEVTVAQVATSRLGRQHLAPIHTWTAAGPEPPPRGRLHPQILYPSNSKTVDVADDLAASLDAWVARRPDWPWPKRDLIDATPARPELSVPSGLKPSEKEPWAQHAGPTPAGRHARRRVILCYRPTPATPARYLGAALMRAGVEVAATDRVNFDRVRPADLVVIVESPTPAIELTGANPGIPVVYWAHHGEHHLEANIRLAHRYGADLVLLAHSWHLAARFDRRVERFPFGVEVGAGEGTKTFAEREWDMAFVGSTEGNAYARRRLLLDQARQGLEQVRIETGFPPSQIPTLYGDARSVLNEGGTRHLPIPMRAFETAGAGALLVTGPAPGIELILGEDYVPIGEPGLDAPALRSTLADGSGEELAKDGRRRALSSHTYDHRVDLLLRLASEVEHSHRPEPAPNESLARFLFEHPYGQRIFDTTGRVNAPDREVWTPDNLGWDPGSATFDTVVIDPDFSPSHPKAARRFVIGFGIDPELLGVPIRSARNIGELVIVDVGGPAYDVDTVGV